LINADFIKISQKHLEIDKYVNKFAINNNDAKENQIKKKTHKIVKNQKPGFNFKLIFLL